MAREGRGATRGGGVDVAVLDVEIAVLGVGIAIHVERT